jgi:molecular chaperone GrpE
MSEPHTEKSDAASGAHSGAGADAGRDHADVADQAGASGSHPEAAASGDGAQNVDALLARAQAEAIEFRDLYLRAKAEVENVRRRGQDDVAKAHKYAIENFAESLLPVRDSLEMALQAPAATPDSLREGVDATLRLLVSAFGKHKLVEIDPVGQKFDPKQHQAISMVPGSGLQPPVAANHVVNVLQKGYMINDRVLRPAMVTVAQA